MKRGSMQQDLQFEGSCYYWKRSSKGLHSTTSFQIILSIGSHALMKLAEMEYGGTTSYFIKLLVEKKYALPYRVVDAMVAHFMRFYEDSRDMPVIWHQSLLAFMQRYKHEPTKDQKEELNYLVKKQRHKMVTPEILRELNNSRNRGEKEDNLMSIYILLINDNCFRVL